MLNAEKILKLMDECKFDDVRKICLSEIAAKMNKEKGGKSAEKAVKAAEKYVKQRCKKLANSALHGWFKVDIGLDDYYCVCDGMTAILLDTEKVADLPFESSEGMNVAQCFPTAWESFEKIEIKEEELKAVHKNARNFTNIFLMPGSKGIIVKFGDMAIDTERMVDDEPNCNIEEMSDEELENLVNTVEQWSKEHPQRTRLQDFREKYPHASIAYSKNDGEEKKMMDKINLLDTVRKDIGYFQDYLDEKKWFNPFEIILKECRTNGEKNGLYSLMAKNENVSIEVAFGTIQEINCALKAMIAWEELNND